MDAENGGAEDFEEENGQRGEEEKEGKKRKRKAPPCPSMPPSLDDAVSVIGRRDASPKSQYGKAMKTRATWVHIQDLSTSHLLIHELTI